MTELWLVDLERAAPALEALEAAEPRLAPDDHARARQFSDAHERRHRLAAYVAQRVALERIVGPGVRGTAFARSANGKPRLAGGEAAFSLSHSDGMALIGVTRRGDIGVDLERARPVRVAPRRRQLIVAAGAGLAGAPLDMAQGEAAFLQAWARLEACAKAQGRGLARLLADVGVRGDGARASPARVAAKARCIAEEAGLEVHDLELTPPLYGAVAREPMVALPRVRTFPVAGSAIRALLASRSTSRRPR